ncbi:MAG: alpha-amylase family glycosyl hydrolase [Microscillaceae bacterium]|nr:alpha-amylase family glycosyl hydrolase [Microscillaceae bacterium]MDW8460353.1 alpha-amylase family glycosyl hydrolase [Cytophagales bacterium]
MKHAVRKLLLLCGLISPLSPRLQAQSTAPQDDEFSQVEITQGYAQRKQITHFLFSEKLYKVKSPQQVVVTGSFRGWNENMNDSRWQLKKINTDLWGLAIENKDMEVIKPFSEFKFRINQGEWLAPPAEATNQKGGNLVFKEKPLRLKAEIRRKRTIWVILEGNLTAPLNPKEYKLTNAQGEIIPVASVLPNTASQLLLTPAVDLDIKRVYFLEIPSQNLKAHCSFDGWFREIYSNKPLGAEIFDNNTKTSFRIFAPRATAMKLYLYKQPDDTEPYQTHDMKQDDDGVWEYIANENLKGVYYDFTVHGYAEPGNFFYETHPVKISDPYARVSLDSWGKCRVWEKTKPATPLKNGRPKMQDIVAYEVHIEDFTLQLPVEPEMKGTIPAFIKSGLRNSKGQKIGFDYLVDLGINVVHLMPVQEFLHWKSDDWQASFKDDPYMIEQGINMEWYEWGYRTTHAFAVESRYRYKKGTQPGEERNQFRDLVQAFHDKGIAVIIDIVPNHTGENMDKHDALLHFNALDKLYYYRTKNFEHIGEYGNEVKFENRPMVQRWLIDQCKHWIEEFGIDGFRIDLAGQIDQQTLIALKNALPPDIIIYGEPWIGSNDPDFENNPDWDWYKADAPITFFQDDARNAFKGPVSNPKNKATDRGFAGGNYKERENVKKGLAAQFPEDKTPISGINYLDIHDNWTLADQFAKKDFDGRFGVDEDNYKIAAVLLYTSQGPIVIHGGTEIMRSKGLAPLQEVYKETKAGIKVFLHGKRDTYNMRNANMFLWENVGKTFGDKDTYCDYKGMLAFWQGLTKFRLSEAGKVFRNAEPLPKDYYQWIEPQNPYMLGYFVNNKVLVLINTEEKENTFVNVQFPKGNWKLIGNNQAVNHLQGVKDEKVYQLVKGEQTLSVKMPKVSFRMWLRE